MLYMILQRSYAEILGDLEDKLVFIAGTSGVSCRVTVICLMIGTYD